MAGLLRHENEVFGYISYKDGAEFPLLIETEGSSAGTPLVSSSFSTGRHNPE